MSIAKSSPQHQLLYSCEKCEEPDDGGMAQCSSCDSWYHYRCAGVNESVQSSDVPWNCSKCLERDTQSSEKQAPPTAKRSSSLKVPTEKTVVTSRGEPAFQKCQKCEQSIFVPQDLYWKGFCDDCFAIYDDESLTGNDKGLPLTTPTSTNVHKSGAVPRYQLKFTSERMCYKCNKLLRLDAFRKGKPYCLRCEQIDDRPIQTQKTVQFENVSQTSSSRRRKELALKKLEEETKLQREYIQKKYQILDESESDENLDDNTSNKNKNQQRTESWISSQNKVDHELSQFTSNPPSYGQRGQNASRSSFYDFRSNVHPSHERTHNAAVSTTVESLRRFSSTPSHRITSSPLEVFRNSEQRRPNLRDGNPNSNEPPPDGQTLTREQLAARQSIGKEAVKFDGKPDEWYKFINFFVESSILCNFSDAENQLRLQRCLVGDAFDAVEQRLYTPNSVVGILSTLRMLFGRPQMIINKLLKKVRDLPPVKQEKLDDLISYSLAVQNLCSTMTSTGLHSHLNNPQLVQDILNKLPANNKMDWSRHKRLNGLTDDDVTIDLLSDWLFILAQDASEYKQFESVAQPSQQKSEHKSKVNNSSLQNKKYVNAHSASVSSSEPVSKITKCFICNGKCRRFSECKKFKQLSQKNKWNEVKKNKVCGKCLDSHDFRSCDLVKKCGIDGCEATHHQLLHNFKKGGENSENTATASPVSTSVSTPIPQPTADSNSKVCTVHQTSQPDVYFKIVPVTLHSQNQSVETYAYLDCGSQVTLMEDDLRLELETAGVKEHLCLSWTSNYTRHEPTSRMISIEISGKSDNTRYPLTMVRTVNDLGLPTQTVIRKEIVSKYSYLNDIPFPEMHNAKPRILIGLQQAKLELPLETVVGEDDSVENPIATRTRLGWFVYGKNTETTNFAHNFKIEVCPCNKNDENLHNLVKEFFSLESFGISATTRCLESAEMERAKRIMETTTIRKDGHFETGLLWRFDTFQLPDSLGMAKRRLECTENKLLKNPELLKIVNDQIKDFEDKGYIRKLTKGELQTKQLNTFYLPMFVVLHPKKPSKVRMVWDAAAKVKGISLNSMLLTGPDLLSALIDILRRFRERRIAICGDILEMFHQIRVRLMDQHAQRFLWRNGNKNSEPEIYVMLVMTFGATCSPSLAQYIKNLNAKDFVDKFPRAAFAIINNHHVDDLLDSMDTVEEAVQLVKDVRYIHKQAGFEIRNFMSNSKSVLAAIGERSVKGTKNLSICKDSDFEKILGMWWNTEVDENDFFTYSLKYTKINQQVVDGSRAPTKREVLKTLMSIYDPLGYLGHFLIFIKILLRNIWMEKIEWDVPITDELRDDWNIWFKLLPMVEEVKIPRHYSSKISKSNKFNIELHTFVDASINAYSAVSYFRIEDQDGIECVLIGAKTKVAPQKLISIPRLELLATVLGSRLTASLRKSHTLNIDKVYMWSDSMDALGWLHSDQRKYRQFVAWRVSEVLELTDISWWNHVPGKLNVADEGTKWTKIPSFDQNSRWFRGPEFLWQSKDQWPNQNHGKPTTNFELKVNLVHSLNIPPSEIIPGRFSKWSRCWRAQAYVFKVRNILMAKVQRRQLGYELSPIELQQAEKVLFKLAQYDEFGEEIAILQRNKTSNEKIGISKSSSIFKCSPYLDESGVMRVYGRIDNIAGIKFDTKRPIILPRNHHITHLVVDDYHRRYLHQNHETVLNEIRQRFYIPKLRVVLKKVISKCQKCKNDRAKPEVPIMGDLPAARLGHHAPPFTFTGMDYFGPIHITDERRTRKRWVVLFTCLTVRAIHLEIATDLSTDTCITCVRNFIAFRGTPAEIYSDNGTNMKGANNELRKELEKLDIYKLSSAFIGPNLNWCFIPPASPHMGGSWERLNRSVKNNLKCILPTRKPTENVLRNLLLEVMDIVNSRPLTYVAVDSVDSDPLTPNHFIHGSSNGLKSGIMPSDDRRLFKGWKYAQTLVNRFWKQWIRTYLPNLTRRTKWFLDAKPLEVGDVVIIVEEKNPRNHWPKGIVLEVRPDKNGNVRSAVVQIYEGDKMKLRTRPVSKLARLDVYKDGEKSASNVLGSRPFQGDAEISSEEEQE